MFIGICGKTNVGKSTFFSSATLVDAEISNRVFTTIKPNVGVAYARTHCACKELGVTCNPKDSKCVDGTRLIPVRLMDIAGLVPGAHEGRGLGNQFLGEIMSADALIHVIDISGSTDREGNFVSSGGDPLGDVKFLEEEIDLWLFGIIKRGLEKGKIRESAAKVLTGLGMKEMDIEDALNKASLSSDDGIRSFARHVRELSKPMLIAGNKADLMNAKSNIAAFDGAGKRIVPCCAEAELALRKAEQKGLIKYTPGNSDFDVIGSVDEKKRSALDFVKKSIIGKYGSTGVQKAIDDAVFELLQRIVVYPVKNESKYSDSRGNVLPNAFLLKKGSTARDLAYKVHTDIGEGFIGAIDCRTQRRIGAEAELKSGDVIKIMSRK